MRYQLALGVYVATANAVAIELDLHKEDILLSVKDEGGVLVYEICRYSGNVRTEKYGCHNFSLLQLNQCCKDFVEFTSGLKKP